MLSRVAQSLYWLGRYVERAENTARLVSVSSHLLLDLPSGVRPDWRPLIDIIGANEAYEKANATYDERPVVRYLLGEKDNPGSVLTSLRAAREQARTIRDVIPRQLWELVNELHHFARDELRSGLGARGRDAYLRRIMRGGQSFGGVVRDIMRHDQSYHFLVLGRLVERADMTTRIVDVRTFDLLPLDAIGVQQPAETVQWVSMLNGLDALQVYRRVVQPRLRRGEVLRFVLMDEDFPRSFFYCVTRAEGVLKQLPRPDASLRQAGRSLRILKASNPDELGHDLARLHDFIDELQVEVGALHTAIDETWFSLHDAEPGG